MKNVVTGVIFFWGTYCLFFLANSYHFRCIELTGHSDPNNSIKCICPYCDFIKSGNIGRSGGGFLVCTVYLFSKAFLLIFVQSSACHILFHYVIYLFNFLFCVFGRKIESNDLASMISLKCYLTPSFCVCGEYLRTSCLTLFQMNCIILSMGMFIIFSI